MNIMHKNISYKKYTLHTKLIYLNGCGNEYF